MGHRAKRPLDRVVRLTGRPRKWSGDSPVKVAKCRGEMLGDVAGTSGMVVAGSARKAERCGQTIRRRRRAAGHRRGVGHRKPVALEHDPVHDDRAEIFGVDEIGVGPENSEGGELAWRDAPKIVLTPP